MYCIVALYIIFLLLYRWNFFRIYHSHFLCYCGYWWWSFGRNGEGRQRVVVVSVVGKSTLDAGGCKAASLEAMVGRKIFDRDMIQTLDLDPNTMVLYSCSSKFVPDCVGVSNCQTHCLTSSLSCLCHNTFITVLSDPIQVWIHILDWECA